MSICKFSNCYNSTNYSWETYCYQHNSESDRLKALVRQRTSLTNPEEVERFSTNWNKNLATVVNSSGYYRVFLLVLDENRQVKVFPISSDCSYWGEHSRGNHNYLSSAQGEANWLRSKLQYSDNPILAIHPSCDVYTGFNNLITSPYVKIDYNAYPSEFKPLDIAWVRKKLNGIEYFHVGVYLGGDELIDFTNDVPGFNSDFLTNLGESISRETPLNFIRGGKVRRVSWTKFKENWTGEMRRYCLVIPFKNYREIVQQLVWAKDNNFREGQYNFANRNCEHFANMVALGINYSYQVEARSDDFRLKNSAQLVGRGARTAAGTATTIALTGWGIGLAPFTFGLSLIPAAVTAGATAVGVADTVAKDQNGDFETNNGKGNTIKLTNEIRESNNKLGKKSDYETRELEARVEQAVPDYISTDSCRIM